MALPVPFPKDPREPVRLEGTSLHHFALEIDKGDFPAELDRLRSLGLDVTTVNHRWCRWRSMYVRDPEGNITAPSCQGRGWRCSSGRPKRRAVSSSASNWISTAGSSPTTHAS
jgi:hypothetical protein